MSIYKFNPICTTICIENGRYSSYVLQWNTTQKQPMKMLLHIFYNLAQTKTVIRKWLANFLLSLSIQHYYVNFILIKWTHFPSFSLHLCLTSSLVRWFAYSNNIEWPDEIDILLETLSESDIQLLDRRVTDDLSDDEHQQDQGITIANASDISCHSTCSENTTDHTSSMSTFAAATETDLKCDLKIYWINL